MTGEAKLHPICIEVNGQQRKRNIDICRAGWFAHAELRHCLETARVLSEEEDAIDQQEKSYLLASLSCPFVCRPLATDGQTTMEQPSV